MRLECRWPEKLFRLSRLLRILVQDATVQRIVFVRDGGDDDLEFPLAGEVPGHVNAVSILIDNAKIPQPKYILPGSFLDSFPWNEHGRPEGVVAGDSLRTDLTPQSHHQEKGTEKGNQNDQVQVVKQLNLYQWYTHDNPHPQNIENEERSQQPQKQGGELTTVGLSGFNHAAFIIAVSFFRTRPKRCASSFYVDPFENPAAQVLFYSIENWQKDQGDEGAGEFKLNRVV